MIHDENTYDEITNFLYKNIDSENYGLDKCSLWLKNKCYTDWGNGDIDENSDLIGYLLWLKNDILEDLLSLLGELVHIEELDNVDKKIRLFIELISEYEE